MINRKGFTLLEVMVTSLIVGIIGLGIVNVLANSNKTLNESARQSVVNSNVMLLLSEISRDIKAGYKLDVANFGSYLNVLTITSRDPVSAVEKTVKWTNKFIYNNSKDYGYFAVRTDENGVEKVYEIIGGKTMSGYKYLIMYFDYPDSYTTFKPSKYYGTDIRVCSYHNQAVSSYWYYNTEASYYCRVQELGI